MNWIKEYVKCFMTSNINEDTLMKLIGELSIKINKEFSEKDINKSVNFDCKGKKVEFPTCSISYKIVDENSIEFLRLKKENSSAIERILKVNFNNGTYKIFRSTGIAKEPRDNDTWDNFDERIIDKVFELMVL